MPSSAPCPAGFRYSVEIRNPEYLSPDYFDMLSAHGVAHVFNAWTRMPELAEQAELPGAFTADFTVVRALLRPGRTYEQAVTLFKPYRTLQESDPSTRDALRRIAERSRQAAQAGFRVREQSPGRQCAVHHRSRRGGPRPVTRNPCILGHPPLPRAWHSPYD